MIEVAAKTIEYIANQRGILLSGSTGLITMSSSEVLDTAIVTKDTPIMLISRYLRFTSGGLTADVFKDSTLELGDAYGTMQNLNGISPKTQTFEIRQVSAVTTQGTIKALPTLALPANSQGNNGGGDSIAADALIIPANSTYHLQITSLDAQSVSSTLTIIDAGKI